MHIISHNHHILSRSGLLQDANEFGRPRTMKRDPKINVRNGTKQVGTNDRIQGKKNGREGKVGK